MLCDPVHGPSRMTRHLRPELMSLPVTLELEHGSWLHHLDIG